MTLAEVTIDGLGAGGDGIAVHAGRRLFVPLTLPGERWRVRVEGERGVPLEPLRLVARAAPPCPHFGRCGGCALQHLPADLYGTVKRERIVTALARQGLHDAPIAATAVSPPGSRRRLRLAAASAGGRLLLGLRRPRSRRIEPMTTCSIARPVLAAVLPGLAAGLGRIGVDEIGLTACDNGLDVALHGRRRLDLEAREKLAGIADGLDLARLSWNGEPVAARRRPTLEVAGVTVAVPSSTFLQATAEGEAALCAAVADWGAGARHVVDLYAGIGTLGLALPAATVHAIEASGGALAALTAARPRTTTETRDLVRRPLQPDELKRFDLAILDPPRAGAAEQVAALAASRLQRIVHASCSPDTFARDARTLVDAGFRLLELRPVDQFLWSPEVELIALFQRP